MNTVSGLDFTAISPGTPTPAPEPEPRKRGYRSTIFSLKADTLDGKVDSVSAELIKWFERNSVEKGFSLSTATWQEFITISDEIYDRAEPFLEGLSAPEIAALYHIALAKEEITAEDREQAVRHVREIENETNITYGIERIFENVVFNVFGLRYVQTFASNKECLKFAEEALPLIETIISNEEHTGVPGGIPNPDMLIKDVKSSHPESYHPAVVLNFPNRKNFIQHVHGLTVNQFIQLLDKVNPSMSAAVAINVSDNQKEGSQEKENGNYRVYRLLADLLRYVPEKTVGIPAEIIRILNAEKDKENVYAVAMKYVENAHITNFADVKKFVNLFFGKDVVSWVTNKKDSDYVIGEMSKIFTPEKIYSVLKTFIESDQRLTAKQWGKVFEDPETYRDTPPEWWVPLIVNSKN